MLRAHIVVMAVGVLLSRVPALPKPQHWPHVDSLQPFTVQTNWMSRDGFARWKYFQISGRWISREETDWSDPQGANVGPAPTG